MMQNHRMPRSRKGDPTAGARPSAPPQEDEDDGFGGPAVPEFRSEVDVPEGPPPEILALGPPPADASGIQKWNYQLLSTMAYLAAKDPTLTAAERLSRVAKLTQAAARHYPEAAKFDLAQKIADDNQAIASKKMAKAQARAEKRGPAGVAKVIPIRRDAEGS